MPEPTPVGKASRGQLIAAFAAVYILWGSTYLAIRFAIETLPPWLMAGARFLVAGGILYATARARGAARPTIANWGAAVLIGALLLLGGNGAVVWAETRVPSGLTALLVATVPIWMVLLDWLQPSGNRPTKSVIAGLILGFIGLGVLIGPGEILGRGQVDLLGAAHFVKQALLRMPPGGAVVNVASIHARETEPQVAPYAAAKAALVSLTRSAAIEGKPRGIRVNAVLPGAVDTPMLWDNPNVRAGVEHVDRAYVGTPEQLAAAIAFLASDDAAFVQGAALVVDGGRLDRL